MAYDSLRHVIVLFGGIGSGYTRLSDTWEWDGSAWNRRAVAGPSARDGFGIVWDSMRGRVVLFGGWDTAANNDCWEWDGASWSRRTISGPPACSFPGMAYDEANATVVLYGGSAQLGTLVSQTWGLETRCPADLDNGSGFGSASSAKDGGVTIDDMLFFLAAYEATDARADLDDGSGAGTPDGGVDINDLLFFLAHYEAGC